MAQRTLILKIAEGRIFFNPELSIALQHSNLPLHALSFHPDRAYYWLVEMQAFHPQKQALELVVMDYETKDLEGFKAQKPKKAVAQVVFSAPLDWRYLEPQLSHYTKIQLGPFVKNLDYNPFSTEGRPDQPVAEQDAKSSVNIKFDIPFSELQIKLGYVSFQKYLERFERTVDFKIANDHLLPEFEHIKYWFAKKLGSKKIKVQAVLHFANGQLEKVEAESRELQAIGPDFIEIVKQQRTYGLSKMPRINSPDKALFSSEDIFEQLSDDAADQGNVFGQSEQEIIALLLQDESIRNRQQLVYLSGAKQSASHKIRFTLAPHFGFLFLVEGDEANHFIWELLNSHATYIWSIGKSAQDIRLQYQRIEQSINTIRAAGRDPYRRAFRDKHLDQDLSFHILEHEHARSALIDGFPKWKHRLNEVLI